MLTMWRQYTVDLDAIGSGTYCKVYKAYDPKGRKLVIKRIDDLDIARREARIMKRYGSSPFLPRYYDFFMINNQAYLVTEFAEGSVLGDNFHNTWGKRRSERISVEITTNILRGIKRLHKLGYIHDDIKPKNVMIKDDRPDTVKVIDFNLAKKIVDDGVMKKELQDVCRMCAFLMKGTLPNIRQSEFKNKELQSVLLNPFDAHPNDRYRSADELIHALKPFR